LYPYEESKNEWFFFLDEPFAGKDSVIFFFVQKYFQTEKSEWILPLIQEEASHIEENLLHESYKGVAQEQALREAPPLPQDSRIPIPKNKHFFPKAILEIDTKFLAQVF
jgi:hypothetical protein